MNDYFNPPVGSLVPFTRARAEDVLEQFVLIAAAFDKLPSPDLVGYKPGPTGPSNNTYAARTDLAAAPSSNLSAFLVDGTRSGPFRWVGTNISAIVAADPGQGYCIAAASDPSGNSGGWVRPVLAPCPEWWGGGAGGDDTASFAALGDFVSAFGGGSLNFSAGITYNVGAQDKVNDGNFMFKPRRLIELRNCPLPVVIRGGGARIRFNPGLYFGAFKADGTPAAANAAGTYSAPCLTAMIDAQGCTGGIVFEGALELDGNAAAMNLGGNWGDTGWQVGGDGFYFSGNTGLLDVSNLHAHHFPRDGVQGSTPNANDASPSTTTSFRNLRLNNNCRNNFSALGGRRWTFIGCDFLEAARNTPFGSAPGSGIDLEAEQSLIRDFHFIDCSFVGNTNNGLVADSGDTRGVRCDNCRFITGGGPALWPNKPDMQFNDCTFVGSVYPFYNLDATRAPKFRRCLFTDDQTLTPYGPVPAGPIINGGGGCNGVLFEDCLARTTQQPAVYLPFDGVNGRAVWRNGSISAPAAGNGAGGLFGAQVEGRVSITGGYDGSGQLLIGRLVSNGVDLTLFTMAIPSMTLPAAGHQSFTIDATGKPVQPGMKAAALLNVNMKEVGLFAYTLGGLVVATFFNTTAAAVTLDAGTLTVRVEPLT